MFIKIQMLSTGYIVTVTTDESGFDLGSIFQGAMKSMLPRSPLDDQIEEALVSENPESKLMGKFIFEDQNKMLAFVQRVTHIMCENKRDEEL